MIRLYDDVNVVECLVNMDDISSVEMQSYGSSGGVSRYNVTFKFISGNDPLTMVLTSTEMDKFINA